MEALNPLGGSKKVNRNAKIKKKDNSLFSKTISLKSELRMELFGTRGAKNPQPLNLVGSEFALKKKGFKDIKLNFYRKYLLI